MLNIRIPSIIDDPIGGRCSSATSILGDLDPINIVSGIDYILIKDGKLGLKRAFEQKPKKVFKINEIEKFLLVKRTVSPWGFCGKFKRWARNGTELEVMLLLKNGERHVLIPAFLLTYGKKDWDLFLHELCKSTELPLEEIQYTSKKNSKMDDGHQPGG